MFIMRESQSIYKFKGPITSSKLIKMATKEERQKIMYGRGALGKKYLKVDSKNGPEDYFFIFKDGTIADVKNGEVGEAVTTQIVRESRLEKAKKKGWDLAVNYFPEKIFQKLFFDEYTLLLSCHDSKISREGYGYKPCTYAVIVPKNQVREKRKEGWETVDKFFKKPWNDVDEIHVPLDEGIFLYLDPGEQKIYNNNGHWYVQNRNIFNWY